MVHWVIPLLAHVALSMVIFEWRNYRFTRHLILCVLLDSGSDAPTPSIRCAWIDWISIIFIDHFSHREESIQSENWFFSLALATVSEAITFTRRIRNESSFEVVFVASSRIIVWPHTRWCTKVCHEWMCHHDFPVSLFAALRALFELWSIQLGKNVTAQIWCAKFKRNFS